MKTVALTEAKDRLSALVDEADRTHEIIEITKHGHRAAVLMSADDLESLRETIRVLSSEDAVRELAAARQAYDAGDTVDGEDLRSRYGMERA